MRDERGVGRESPPSDCFRSYEDIIALERKIESNDYVDFMVECIALGYKSYRDLANMYVHAATHSQLETFRDAVGRLRSYTLSAGITSKAYALAFKRIAERGNDFTPTWREVKKYLRIFKYIDCRPTSMFGANIRADEIDEALNCVLNGLAAAHRGILFTDGRRTIIETSLRFLERGASLFFKGPDEKRSSLVALLSACDGVKSERLFSEFSSYLCCRLEYKGTMVTFDAWRPASLTCLAARSMLRSEDSKRLPLKLRSFVEAHRELQLYFETRTPSSDWYDPHW